jgi:hypothetical protein
MAAQPIRSALKPLKPRLTPRCRDVPETAELLCYRHGDAKARKLAGLEQKRARRARSRKQFAFWAAVVAEIELRRGIAPDDGEAKSVRLVARTSGEVIGAEILEGKASE